MGNINKGKKKNKGSQKDKNVEEKKEEKPSQKKDDAIKITLFEWQDIDKGKEWRKLFDVLPKYGTIEYEAPNKFWSIELGEEWTNVRKEVCKLTDKLYSNTDWYKEGIKRGYKWANEFKEENPQILTIPPTSLSGAHITLGRIDKDSNDCPKCFKIGGKVEFEKLKLICHPPFRPYPKNLPGQTTEDNGLYRFYATHWMTLPVKFVNFDYQTRFPPHISLCNIAVKLKIEKVDKYEQNQQQKK